MKTLITITLWWAFFSIATGCSAPEAEAPTKQSVPSEEAESDGPIEEPEEKAKEKENAPEDQE